MTVYEVATIALIFVVASAATLAIYLGLLNWMGRFHVVHCSASPRPTRASPRSPSTSSPPCRAPLLLLPGWAGSPTGGGGWLPPATRWYGRPDRTSLAGVPGGRRSAWGNGGMTM